VQANQVVQDGQYLGLGGSTGYSSSPHLHFEIQRSTDNFTGNVWSVDPNGWSGPGADPWPYQNVVLWRYELAHRFFLPSIFDLPWVNPDCPGCGELLRNNGFEAGPSDWVEIGVDIITHTSHHSLPVEPYAGSWLGWLGGRNNAADTLHQDFQVPGGLVGARLAYYTLVTTTEGGGVYDRFFVRLRSNSGELIQDLDALDNAFQPANQWVRREIDLSALAGRPGETLRISFEAATDNADITNFFVDEISLEATGP
jgi:hypothetical protein